jgi:argininosuccinate synthase
MADKEKVVLAFSGGLDTSIALKWLQNERNLEVITFTADIGQDGEIDEAKEKAKKLGVKEIFVKDLKDEFVKDYIFPMFRANALYEGYYLLGTSIARPLIAKKQLEIAKKVGANYVAHGATGKGNDQIRFELGYYANNPKIRIIAPWREWNLKSRNDLLSYAKKCQIPIPKDKLDDPPYSMDANLLHTSYEGRILEDPWKEPEESMFTRTVHCEKAPDKATNLTIEFMNGDPISINQRKYKPSEILNRLNLIGGENGVGRIDIVENRFVGMKSRGVYETPGGEILLVARRAIESLTLDKGASHLKDELMPKYAELIYNGFWFSPERIMLQSLIDDSQKMVSGSVKLKIYKGNVIVQGRKSNNSLYSSEMATFEEDDVYNQSDAEGFIKLNALRLKLLKNRR